MESSNPGVCSASSHMTCNASSSSWIRQDTLLYLALALIAIGAYNMFLVLFVLRAIGASFGWYLRTKTAGRRASILSSVAEPEVLSEGSNVGGSKNTTASSLGRGKIIGFFHPFCNAGGGGERVLWAAIRATQTRWPKARIVVYTGDLNVSKSNILSRVKHQFNIDLHSPTITFLYLSTRHWVLPSTWPRFTLIGQSIGSLILAWDAFQLVVPDAFIDTMGYAFALGLCKFLFRNVPTGAYVHYPTISTDMLTSLDPNSPTGNLGVNAGQGVGWKGKAKKIYWQLFALLYSRAGASVDIVMTNSSWTQGHINKLWAPYRTGSGGKTTAPITVVYPPVAVEEMASKIEVSAASESQREKVILCIAQFRPEKNHQILVESFAKFVATHTPASEGSRLVLIGSVRDDADSKLVYELRLLVNELGVKDRVDFVLDAPWPNVLQWLSKASVGVNGMWNEHFGIGVVEYEAAGLIPVVHNSGGPKLDIVTEVDGKPVGFHATTAEEFAQCYEKALSLEDPLAVRLRARQSAQRFTEHVFATRWIEEMERLMALSR
ncbi:GDP-Man:Man(3)GlcNAc(2)-PP-Dol alpha-1,2-mannosyltransferase [Ceratocystis fimbriata CBS 114723]|uniref:GDP-Man:Man(3)GlcNAc(2)-PP-Dol alpha-1,2-mannosyltransferase n=1 Tax=Ceratocystis fimbriata CBS 114723 TaxID=1035309 RepID=A0A2C5XHJ0_9PEZI|nr:GDP-Man:Man(3)GlcNAc(2)-PP-Dol alpha-1,2-mannosyltransferase [Ceratocystis fimbriata CBS 114723]